MLGRGKACGRHTGKEAYYILRNLSNLHLAGVQCARASVRKQGWKRMFQIAYKDYQNSAIIFGQKEIP